MCEPRRNPHHLVVLFVQLGPEPFAEVGGADADVDGDVEKGPSDAPHELSLSIRLLIVEASQHTFRRPGVVVLNEDRVEAGMQENVGPVGFHKKSAGVAVDLRLDDSDPRKRGFGDVQSARMIQFP